MIVKTHITFVQRVAIASIAFVVTVVCLSASATAANAQFGPITFSGGDTFVSEEADQIGGGTVYYEAPTAEDDDGFVDVNCDYASPSVFDIGTTTVTCSATNADSYEEIYIDIEVTDTISPDLDISSTSFGTYEATSLGGAFVNFTLPQATDIADPDPVVECLPYTGSIFPLGVTIVSCSASDESGNVDLEDYTLTVVDTTAPVFNGSPTNVEVEANDATGGVVNYTPPTATDIVDGVRTSTCTPASGSRFALGTTNVTCSASDAAGNSTSTSFNVKVVPGVTGFAIANLKRSGKRKLAVALNVPVGGTITLTATGPKSVVLASKRITPSTTGPVKAKLTLSAKALKKITKKSFKLKLTATIKSQGGSSKTFTGSVKIRKS